MAKVAVLVDLSFFLKRYNRIKREKGAPPHSAASVARSVWATSAGHLEKNKDQLHRILVYDCHPFGKKAHNPITGKSVDFGKSPQALFRSELAEQLKQKRKLALRMGELKDGRRWQFQDRVVKDLLAGRRSIDDLTKDDVYYDFRQKGVDIKIGIDIVSLALKRLVDRIVLITGDADFVPAAKLARREGVDIVLDPLWSPISADLHEHIDGLQSVWNKPEA